MKDFTKQARVVEFQLNGDTYRGKPHLAAQTMIDFTLKVGEMDQETATAEQGFGTMMDSLQMVLMPESYSRFRAHMNDGAVSEDAAAEALLLRLRSQLSELGDGKIAASQVLSFLDTAPPAQPDTPDNAVPIELDQVTEILEWVMGEYGLRPTKPSEDSSDGPSSPESGTNSTDSTSDVESTSLTSPSTDS